MNTLCLTGVVDEEEVSTEDLPPHPSDLPRSLAASKQSPSPPSSCTATSGPSQPQFSPVPLFTTVRHTPQVAAESAGSLTMLTATRGHPTDHDRPDAGPSSGSLASMMASKNPVKIQEGSKPLPSGSSSAAAATAAAGAFHASTLTSSSSLTSLPSSTSPTFTPKLRQIYSSHASGPTPTAPSQQQQQQSSTSTPSTPHPSNSQENRDTRHRPPTMAEAMAKNPNSTSSRDREGRHQRDTQHTTQGSPTVSQPVPTERDSRSRDAKSRAGSSRETPSPSPEWKPSHSHAGESVHGGGGGGRASSSTRGSRGGEEPSVAVGESAHVPLRVRSPPSPSLLHLPAPADDPPRFASGSSSSSSGTPSSSAYVARERLLKGREPAQQQQQQQLSQRSSRERGSAVSAEKERGRGEAPPSSSPSASSSSCTGPHRWGVDGSGEGEVSSSSRREPVSMGSGKEREREKGGGVLKEKEKEKEESKNPLQPVPGLSVSDRLTIHVCDENRRMERDFICSRSKLLGSMKYFESYLGEAGLSGGEELDITVHCDINVFVWLLKYLNDPAQADTLEVGTVVSILISSHFLKIAALVDACLEFVKANMAQVLRLPIDLGCLPDDLVERLQRKFSCEELERLKDRRGILLPKLWEGQLRDLIKNRQREGLEVARCSYCKELFAEEFREVLICPRARLFIDFHGQMIARHVADKDWEIESFVTYLKEKEGKSFRDIFWVVWGRVHCLQCSRKGCGAFPVAELFRCMHHLASPHFDATGGFFPCCLRPAKRFSPTATAPDGCSGREHCVVFEEGDLSQTDQRTGGSSSLRNLQQRDRRRRRGAGGISRKLLPSGVFFAGREVYERAKALGSVACLPAGGSGACEGSVPSMREMALRGTGGVSCSEEEDGEDLGGAEEGGGAQRRRDGAEAGDESVRQSVHSQQKQRGGGGASSSSAASGNPGRVRKGPVKRRQGVDSLRDREKGKGERWRRHHLQSLFDTDGLRARRDAVSRFAFTSSLLTLSGGGGETGKDRGGKGPPSPTVLHFCPADAVAVARPGGKRVKHRRGGRGSSSTPSKEKEREREKALLQRERDLHAEAESSLPRGLYFTQTSPFSAFLPTFWSSASGGGGPSSSSGVLFSTVGGTHPRQKQSSAVPFAAAAAGTAGGAAVDGGGSRPRTPVGRRPRPTSADGRRGGGPGGGGGGTFRSSRPGTGPAGRGGMGGDKEKGQGAKGAPWTGGSGLQGAYFPNYLCVDHHPVHSISGSRRAGEWRQDLCREEDRAAMDFLKANLCAVRRRLQRQRQRKGARAGAHSRSRNKRRSTNLSNQDSRSETGTVRDGRAVSSRHQPTPREMGKGTASAALPQDAAAAPSVSSARGQQRSVIRALSSESQLGPSAAVSATGPGTATGPGKPTSTPTQSTTATSSVGIAPSPAPLRTITAEGGSTVRGANSDTNSSKQQLHAPPGVGGFRRPTSPASAGRDNASSAAAGITLPLHREREKDVTTDGKGGASTPPHSKPSISSLIKSFSQALGSASTGPTRVTGPGTPHLSLSRPASGRGGEHSQRTLMSGGPLPGSAGGGMPGSSTGRAQSQTGLGACALICGGGGSASAVSLGGVSSPSFPVSMQGSDSRRDDAGLAVVGRSSSGRGGGSCVPGPPSSPPSSWLQGGRRCVAGSASGMSTAGGAAAPVLRRRPLSAGGEIERHRLPRPSSAGAALHTQQQQQQQAIDQQGCLVGASGDVAGVSATTARALIGAFSFRGPTPSSTQPTSHQAQPSQQQQPSPSWTLQGTSRGAVEIASPVVLPSPSLSSTAAAGGKTPLVSPAGYFQTHQQTQGQGDGSVEGAHAQQPPGHLWSRATRRPSAQTVSDMSTKVAFLAAARRDGGGPVPGPSSHRAQLSSNGPHLPAAGASPFLTAGDVAARGGDARGARKSARRPASASSQRPVTPPHSRGPVAAPSSSARAKPVRADGAIAGAYLSLVETAGKSKDPGRDKGPTPAPVAAKRHQAEPSSSAACRTSSTPTRAKKKGVKTKEGGKEKEKEKGRVGTGRSPQGGSPVAPDTSPSAGLASHVGVEAADRSRGASSARPHRPRSAKSQRKGRESESRDEGQDPPGTVAGTVGSSARARSALAGGGRKRE
uniref:SANT and BTB domain-containing protein n=1 Tax=Chromera velia CCMP2878 TaxID=1169474 RepID=A0A0G4ICP8_9ALVE|eukprot:Cvel_13209.t1-p1 / transcript=Cvel_13209.t1 / gene=Cvel_13209 / organism=Chromera_velia_CCMP2878 / gene_product=Uncharacterized protein KIAA1841, putative / transcript_product=Uncharacterized protein KIAA1841, putative / location=Cvel_scaffold894:13532-24106(-) / protein_length=2117 / sequence_SO=supercontig / SO=protein_coding / is_pseudo=false